MTITEAIENRRSIRKYLPIDVPMEHLVDILHAAMLAPSAGNTRPWDYIVVKNKELIQKLHNVHPWSRSLTTAPALIIVLARPERQFQKEDNCWPIDCGAVSMTILFAAMEFGYGTCWCGVYPYEKIVSEFQKILNTNAIPVSMISIGVPDEDPAQKGFFDDSIVTYLV